jgi:hypothetical protein
MSQAESPEPLSEEPGSPVSAAEAEPEAPAPEPEPWTPARVIEWNAYYDIYVAIGVLLLAFMASANEITHAPLWTWLQAGRTMAAQGKPLVTDLFSYTETGGRWVNVPWLFEWGHALLYDGVAKAAPANPADPLGSEEKKAQFGAAALVALTALVRAATVWVLLAIRRPGPGLWWSSVVAAMALAVFVGPLGPAVGGIGGPAIVAPETWATLLLAVELYLWYRTVELGHTGAVWGLIPLFLLWANIDESFLVGLLVLAAGVLGRIRERSEGNPLSWRRGFGILAACVVVCLANPSFHRLFPAAFSSMAHPFQRTPAVPMNMPSGLEGVGRVIALLYWVCVAGGVASFILNHRRFSLSRLLMFAAAALVWAAYLSERAQFAVVFAATVALNGQEWYHDRFGTEGRVERGWTAFSVGGRAVTIILVFTFVAMARLGWGKSLGDPIFGFGYNPDAFAFKMADFVRTANIQGRILNTTREQGDAMVWRSYPSRQTFIDSRSHLFPTSLQERLQATRKALASDDVAGWKPLLDEYKISAVVIDEPSSPRTCARLKESPNWILFYDDGSVFLFGRADAPGADLAYFRSRQLKAAVLAFEKPQSIPPPENTPMAPSWLDRLDRNRALREPQPYTTAALHWLQTQGSEDRSETGRIPDPAHCIMAIRQARLALASRADDSGPYRILSEAYRILMLHESALLDGVKLTPESTDAVLKTEPRTSLLFNRFRQRATALNQAIQTTPPPRTELERQALFTLNFQLFQLYMGVNNLDLARDRLQAIIAYQPQRLEPEMASGLKQELVGLNQQIKAIQDELNDLTIEQQLDSAQRAAFARSRGAPGLALAELEEADRTGVRPAQVRPQLVDLYCDTGQPDKALDLLNNGSIDEASLETEPGAAAARQARVNFLLGYYEVAEQLWRDRAITRLRHERAMRALIAGASLLHGQAKSSTSLLLDIPGKIALQASWEFDVALCQLEWGRPDLAATAFTESLSLAPDMALRPVVAYYLEKLGKPVPAPSAEAGEQAKK